MERAELDELSRLLAKLAESELRPPRMPREIWLKLHALVPQPAVEVVVTRTGQEVLLKRRRDEHWDGWEIPGGFMLYRESVEDACVRIARREIGVGVALERLVSAYMWPDHPYGSPLSLVCVCKLQAEPRNGQFFRDLPEPVVPHHADFVATALGLKPPTPGCAE